MYSKKSFKGFIKTILKLPPKCGDQVEGYIDIGIKIEGIIIRAIEGSDEYWIACIFKEIDAQGQVISETLGKVKIKKQFIKFL